ncbi:MAG TPA: DNA primase [Rhizomicrobium sp.]|nr:DNA primase [Rhizomicrobium sp.]
MRYGDGLLEEIRRRTDLVQLVGRRVKLIRKGRVMWGCCPFHAEKSPSFKVENERHAYKCFGCGAGGDAFKWLVETEGLTFREAVEKLAAEAGVELPKWSPDDEAREQKRKSLYEIVELAAQFYEAQLFAPEGAKARDYLKRRGLDGQAAKQFRLGYAPNSGQALIEFLKEKNVTQDDMLAAGLARSSDNQPLRDFFFNRVMFAITDGRGRVIAFGGRALEDDAKPKYINSGENPLFSKGTHLYNFATARAAAIKAGTVIVAEGYMDVIALVRAGFAHAVAPLGTALTEDQLHLLWRTTPEPVFSFDGDAAGAKAAERAARLALPHLKAGYSLRFVFLPAGEDPDSLIGKTGPHAMAALLDQAMALSDMLWRTLTEGKDFSTPERRAGLERDLSHLTAEITDAKVADYYRRDFEQRVFEKFKRRPAPQRRPDQGRSFRNPAFKGQYGQGQAILRPQPGTAEAVSPAVKTSLLARAGQAGKARDAALARKETELALLLLELPGLALRHGELVAELAFHDRSLDRLRHELLNLAASGSSLEKAPVLTHLERLGMAELLAKLGVSANPRPPESVPEDETEARFLRASADFRGLAEWEPERERALKRFAQEGSEEAWREASRFLRTSHE